MHDEYGIYTYGSPFRIPGTCRLKDNISSLQVQVVVKKHEIICIGELIEYYYFDLLREYGTCVDKCRG
jgi:hypothetical protein